MATDRGVTCTQCGASTRLPDDLRTPTFACAFCKATLETAAYAGAAAVSADALVGHMESALANPASAVETLRSAPRFQGGGTESRPGQCRSCSGPVAIPLDLAVSEFVCPGCQQPQRVNHYIPDRERFELDQARQIAGNEALKRLEAQGVPCTKCGGLNPYPGEGSVQLVCKFCGAAVLLSDHVDAATIARHRLKHGVFGIRDEAMRQEAARQRRVGLLTGGVVVVLLLFFAALQFFTSR